MPPPVEDFLMEEIGCKFQSVNFREEFTGREIIVMRASETIEDVFPDWIKQSRLDDHFYLPFDLNVPSKLPRRNNPTESFAADPPLSEYGKLMAQMFARHLFSRGAPTNGPISIYSAPSLAALQTAHEISHYLKHNCRSIRIDSGVVGNPRGFDNWLPLPALTALGFDIDIEYRTSNGAERSESLEDTAERVWKVWTEVANDGERHVAVVITDALAVSILNRECRQLQRLSTNIFTEREKANEAVPPGSFLTFTLKKGMFIFHPLRVPALTDINGTNRVDLDDGVDFTPGHAA